MATSRTGDPAGRVVVSVTGAVRHPGLVRLPPGARVADAIGAAGGARDQRDLTGVNLAARVTDGQSIVIGPIGSRTGSGSATAGPVAGTGSGGGADGAAPGTTTGPSGGLVDLNSADVAALDALPGVGPVTAANIVAWRDKNGLFASVEQLQEISGIGPAKYSVIAPLVTV